MKCSSASGWTLPVPVGALEGSCPPSVKDASPLSRPSAVASGPPGDGSSEKLSRPSLSGDRGRQWSGICSSEGEASGKGPGHSGFFSMIGPLRPGKQMTARYQ